MLLDLGFVCGLKVDCDAGCLLGARYVADRWPGQPPFASPLPPLGVLSVLSINNIVILLSRLMVFQDCFMPWEIMTVLGSCSII
jgi:hypothetical protein